MVVLDPRLPNFLILGAAKAGTSSLANYMSKHPDVHMSPLKEANFFSHDGLWDRGLEWYLHLHFDGAARFKARGEATPGYLFSRRAPARVAATLGASARYIVVLRDPVQRAWSWYWHQRRNGKETLSFTDAIEAEPSRRADPELDRAGSLLWAYVSSGRYAEQLDWWWRELPRESFLVLLHEDLEADLPGVMARIFSFIGVDPVEVDTNLRSNRAGVPRSRLVQNLIVGQPAVAHRLRRWVPSSLKPALVRANHRVLLRLRGLNEKPSPKPVLEPGVEQAVRELFREDVVRLQDLIERDLSSWLP
jgi:hypothetical protein